MAGTFADSNRASLRYLAEDSAAWGVTPNSGVPREMRITGSQLAPKKETKTSEELRSDRMVPGIAEVGASAEGEINFELSAGAIDDFLAAFLYGVWSRPMGFDVFKGKHVSITDTDEITIGGDWTVYLTVGRKIKTEGFLTTGNNTYATIATVTFTGGNTVVTVTGATFVAEAASEHTTVLDANDVILMKSTDIRFGTGGASAIDSNGTNAFAAAIAAGQLKLGQKIHVDGLGFEAGSVVLSGVPGAGSKVTISDGVKQKIFQWGGVVAAGVVGMAVGASATAAGDNLAAAIMLEVAKGNLALKAVNTTGTVAITNLAAVAGGSIVETTDISANIAVTNFAGGIDSLRGIFTVTSVADDVIGVFPAPATNANAGPVGITVKGSIIRNPGRVQDFVRQSFTVETSFEDVNQHFVATGLRVGSFELAMKSGEISTGTIQLMGRAMERRQTQTSLLRNAPYTPKDAPAHDIMNATSNVGSLAIDGVVGAAFLQEITISGDASLREQRAVGNKYAVGIGVGRFQLTGKFSAYFETGELFDKFVDHDTISLSFFYHDNAKNRYDFTIPAIKLTADPIAPEGIDQDVVENIEWEAQRDPATNCMIQIDRFSSTMPAMA
ncbi:phage tail tube protein [Mesorhizobium sp. M8A.F.Ca.ET.021.01.1.1]|uniref:phage tail tube protein n=1 Tax=Mesorhizobium sp. M8A.F.Ca.ET.021.01.1.1 TaxID=2496757 RepID=UPI000FCB08FD|nr:phage tail tube protein [Mesorhizobium sp. M8A.F.Ca.ET.021.01.1.1]RUW56741.1 hypothetical protein EOA36_02840 [Mesorhizobium sp. M8A.F.Ca.ET.021.01.1.1]